MSLHSSATAALPVDFVSRLSTLYGQEKSAEIQQTFAAKRVTSFRPNFLKTDMDTVFAELTAAGFILERVDWLNAFILQNKGLRELEEQPLYAAGALYVQGLSSMIPPIILAPEKGESIVDIAAAPGSKTTQMAALMQNEGMIFANDTSTVRLYKLQANIKKLGVTNVRTQRGLGETLWRNFPEVFDRALVDVPCSMEGRFNLAKPKTLENWSVRKIKELANRQRSLLRSAISMTKVGGTIVYSTCTLAPEENEGVIDWILQREKNSVVLEEITIPEQLSTPAVTEWLGKSYHPTVTMTKRIVPTYQYEGFFIAKLKKIASNTMGSI